MFVVLLILHGVALDTTWDMRFYYLTPPFGETGSLCSTSCLGTQCVDQAGLEPTEIHLTFPL